MNTKKVFFGLLFITLSSQATEGQNSLPHIQACFKQKAGAVAANAPLSIGEGIKHIGLPITTIVLSGAAAFYITNKSNTLSNSRKNRIITLAAVLPSIITKFIMKKYYPSVAHEVANDSYKLKKNLALSELESLEEMVEAIEIDVTTQKLTPRSVNAIIHLAQSTNFLKSTQKYSILDVVDKLQTIDPITDNLKEHFETLEQRTEKGSDAHNALQPFRKGLDKDTKKLSAIISCLKASNEYKEAYAIARQERMDEQNEETRKAQIANINAETSNKKLGWFVILKELFHGKEHTITLKK